MIKATTRLVIAVLFSISSLTLHANTTLRVALGETDYRPFYYYDRTAQRWQGVSIDVCQTLASQLGYDLEFVKMPFSRVLANLESGQADMACTLFNTRSRSPSVVYTSVPHVFEDIYLVALADNPILQETELDTIKQNYRIGGVRGYYYGDALLDAPSFRKIEADNDQHLAKLLVAERVDAVLSNLETLRYYTRDILPANATAHFANPVYHGPIYMAFSRNHPKASALASAFTKALVAYQHTQAYGTLLQTYHLNPPEFDQ